MASVFAYGVRIEREDFVSRIVEALVADADGQLEFGIPRQPGQFAERAVVHDTARRHDASLGVGGRRSGDENGTGDGLADVAGVPDDPVRAEGADGNAHA